MRVAIIGNGSIGQRHARDALSLGHEVLRYDVRRDRSDVVTPGELWDWQPEAAIICTPPDSHLAWAIEATAHGCHLFVEKPLGLSLDGWQGAEAFCRVAGLTTHVACPLRYVPALAEIKTLGRPQRARASRAYFLPALRPAWRTGYYNDTGAILEFGSHALDLLQWFMGPAKVRHVSAEREGRIGLTCEEQATVELAHEDGLSWFAGSWLADRPWHVEAAGRDWERNWTMGDNIDGAYVAELAAFLVTCEGWQEPDNPLSEAIGTLATLLEARAWNAQ